MNSFSNAFKLTKPGIAVLLDLVAATTFFMGIRDISLIWKIVPLLAAGTLASFSSSLANNYFDRDLDSRMKRTNWRISAGTNVGYLISIPVLLASSLAITLLFLNYATAVWIFLGFLSYSFLYTMILKRRTTMNIVIGGIAGSFPALAGWSAISTPISWASIFIAAIVFLWTPVHFWSLALKYKDDYKGAGIPMLPAVVDESKSVMAIIISTIILITFSFIPVFVNVGLPALYKYALIPVSAYLIFRVILLKAKRNRNLEVSALKAFLSSNYYLTAILLILVAGSLLRVI